MPERSMASPFVASPARVMVYIHRYNSPLGWITEASDGKYLTGLWFNGQKLPIGKMDFNYKEKELPVFNETDRWLDAYFRGKVPDFTPPLFLESSEFCKTVWNSILNIPYGKTAAYSEIAKKLASNKNLDQMSARAVGGAVGRNPILLIVPCHRIIGVNGNLTGYSGGIERKIKLLEMEGVDINRLFAPITTAT